VVRTLLMVLRSSSSQASSQSMLLIHLYLHGIIIRVERFFRVVHRTESKAIEVVQIFDPVIDFRGVRGGTEKLSLQSNGSVHA
jgi:hypothetical protein